MMASLVLWVNACYPEEDLAGAGGGPAGPGPPAAHPRPLAVLPCCLLVFWEPYLCENMALWSAEESGCLLLKGREV